MGVRKSSGLIAMGAAPNVSVNLWTLSLGKKAVIKKVMYINRTVGGGVLRIGYLTLGAVFTAVLPDIFMVAGVDGELTEQELPICGNEMEGFKADTTLVTGSLGNIIAQASVAGAGVLQVQVTIEVEED